MGEQEMTDENEYLIAENAKLNRQRDTLLRVLRKISSPTQTENLTWWQNEARVAIAAVENQK